MTPGPVRSTRQGARYAVAAITTATGRIGAVVYPANLPRVLTALGPDWRPGTPVCATGRIDRRTDGPDVLCVLDIHTR